MTHLKQALKNVFLAIGLAGIIGCFRPKTEIKGESYEVTNLWLKNIAGDETTRIVEYVKDGKKSLLYDWGLYDLSMSYDDRKDKILTFDSTVTGKSYYKEFYTLHLPENGGWEWKKQK